MGQLNLYKIDAQKCDEFEAAIEEKFDMVGDWQIVDKIAEGHLLQFKLSFYVDVPDEDNDVEWNWLLRFFGDDGVTSRSNPKGVLVIKAYDEVYSCTYGFSYFVVDKFCDTNFAFEFAKRIRYKEVKTITLLSPNLRRNKTVNTYLNYSNLEFDSGESFAKLKVKAALSGDFKIFASSIEVGHSIKFEIPDDSVDAILDVLVYVKETIANSPVIYGIPVFHKVSDKEVINNLNLRLKESLEQNPLAINLSELDIIGVTEIFNKNDSMFIIKYGRNETTVSLFTAEEINDFIAQHGLSLYESLEKVKIISYNNGISVRTDALYNLIDFIDDELRCVLSKGKWYRFNDDYLRYLYDSISEVNAIYNPQYDYNTSLHEQFLSEMYGLEMNDSIYKGLEQEKVKEMIRKKYYRERAYNLYLSQTFGFECYDREETLIGDSKIEIMDLYKNETLYAVKIGNTSSVLCYTLEQSTSTMKLYKHNLLPNLPVAKNISAWLVLDRRNHLNIVDGKPDINQLEMFMLKNRIDAWKKEIRLLGYNPIIMINYFN